MCNASAADVVAAIMPILLLTVSCAGSDGGPHTQRYPSPTAVFDAFREARSKGDWHKLFFCLTAEAQNDAVFEAFFASAERDSKEDRAILKKYDLDEATLTDTLKKEYKAKHGVYPDDATLKHALDKEYGADPSKSGAVQRDAESGPPPGATHRAVMRNILAAHVKDKVGFFEAHAKLSEKRRASPFGALEQLAVHGDTATGRTAITGLPNQKVGEKIYKTFRFRRVNGGWLLDSL